MDMANILDSIKRQISKMPICELCNNRPAINSVCKWCQDCLTERDLRREAVRITNATIPRLFEGVFYGYETGLIRRVSGGLNVIRKSMSLSEEKMVLLTGSSGAGKTTLGVCELRDHAHKTAMRGTFMLASELARSRRNCAYGQEAYEVKEAKATPFLMLDELTADHAFKDSPIEEVIFKRHAEERKTWITTWMGAQSISDIYGNGFARRLFEKSTIIDCETNK